MQKTILFTVLQIIIFSGCNSTEYRTIYSDNEENSSSFSYLCHMEELTKIIATDSGLCTRQEETFICRNYEEAEGSSTVYLGEMFYLSPGKDLYRTSSIGDFPGWEKLEGSALEEFQFHGSAAKWNETDLLSATSCGDSGEEGPTLFFSQESESFTENMDEAPTYAKAFFSQEELNAFIEEYVVSPGNQTSFDFNESTFLLFFYPARENPYFLEIETIAEYDTNITVHYAMTYKNSCIGEKLHPIEQVDEATSLVRFGSIPNPTEKEIFFVETIKPYFCLE